MRGLLKRGGAGTAPVRSEGQKLGASEPGSAGERVRCLHAGIDCVEQSLGKLIMGQLLSSVSLCLSFLVCTQTLRGAEGRAPWRLALRGRPKQVLCFPVPAPLRGRDGHVGPDSANYIPHNSVHRRHLGRWAVAAWGLALQAARPVLLTPILGLHHRGCGIPPSRASGDLGNSCLLSPLLHTWDPSPRVGPYGEACSLLAGQGSKYPDVRGSHVSSPDTHPAHSAHSPPFPDVPLFLLQ